MNQWWAWVSGIAILLVAAGTVMHALLYKRDTRAVIAWVAMIVLLPIAGAIFYWLLAVNRIERRARRLRPQPAGHGTPKRCSECLPAAELVPQALVGDAVSPFPLCDGNRIDLHEDGDAAYPAMLDAIARARHSVALASYIFDGDTTGIQFVAALAAARARGVEIRVLLDAHGRRNRHGNMVTALRRADVPVAEFMPGLIRPTLSAFNLRNHRKLLVVDGKVVFTGGMNITGDHRVAESPRHPVRDIHFELDGPVVGQLMQVFADDWEFTTKERLRGALWFPDVSADQGRVLARAIPDGPDENFEALKLVLGGAIAQARRSIAIVTPYFLPDQPLISALNTAALRGVEVDILLPGVNDHPVVQWASQALYWQLLERGCRIWHSPAPFDHSKLMLVDEQWALIGSSNWDPRSLRLNFELNVEIYDAEFGARMRGWFNARRDVARRLTKSEMDGRSVILRLRDGAARLLTPYL